MAIPRTRKTWRDYFWEVVHGFLKTLPIWLLVVGGFFLFLGYHLRDDNSLRPVFYTLSSAILSGGVFAAVIKTIQFMGVFREEIQKILFADSEWLKSLPVEQLRSIWR